MKKFLFCHPLGNRNAANALKALSESGILGLVVTAFYVSGNFLKLSLPSRAKKELKRRNWIEISNEKILQFPLIEIFRIVFLKLGIFRDKQANLVNLIYKNIDKKASQVLSKNLKSIRAVYAYEDAAFDLFKVAKNNNIKTFYDLPTLHFQEVRKFHQSEYERFPEFRSCLSALDEPDWKLERKRQELILADKVIVASYSTFNSLVVNNIDKKKIKIMPYGADFSSIKINKKENNKNLELLYVGRVTPMKGIHYLIEAVKKIKNKKIKLRIVGLNNYPNNWLEKTISRNNENISLVGSLPYEELASYYLNSDLFVFPSLYEGFGLVILEAMSYGLPVLSSDVGIAADLLKDGQAGEIIDCKNINLLAEKILYYYENRDSLKEMSQKTQDKIKLYSWGKYRQELSEYLINNI